MGIDFTGKACAAGLKLVRNAAKALPLSCACKRICRRAEEKA